jgi:ABC-type transport system substrate-binding protein
MKESKNTKKYNKTIRLAASVCALMPLGIATLFSCAPRGEDVLENVVQREDYTSLYDTYGKSITLNEVTEDENGLAYIEVDGQKRELGMDFLSMAMVYNATPTPAFPTATAAYNEWWKLFMQRFNYLVPEVPLYSNRYYDVYNAKIDKLDTSPYWSVTDAIVSAKVISGENAVILGSNTDLTGSFRNAGFGKSAPGAADNALQKLCSGYSTVSIDKNGNYVWAGTSILPEHTQTQNADGSLTYTIRIAPDLTFSNGERITAKHYLIGVLAGSSKVMREAGGSDAAGLALVGYEDFNAYDGESAGKKCFSGIRLLDDYTFSVTIKPEYANYYYALSYGAFTPEPLGLYLSEGSIADDGEGAYLDERFYARSEKNGIISFSQGERIAQNMQKFSAQDFPYSGPYYVENYDSSTRTASLKRNPLYKGDERGKASIERISYVKMVMETQLDQLKKGRIDVLSSVTGGEETKAALAVVDNVRFKETHYDRAGYGKLAFRCDFGATAFAAVRRAVMYTIDRNEFAQVFTGGYGSVVDAPYHAGSAAYQVVKDVMKLNKYPYSVESAKAELIAGGFIYNDKGEPFDEGAGGVRYKKLEGYEKTYNNLTFASIDNKYKTVKVDGEYYMPLVINWMGTQPNLVTDQLITAWQNNPNAGEKIGMYITYSSGDMTSALYGEYYQMPAYGFTKARYGAVNFATGFTGAAYDQSLAWTINPDRYAQYSVNFLKDEADFLHP